MSRLLPVFSANCQDLHYIQTTGTSSQTGPYHEGLNIWLLSCIGEINHQYWSLGSQQSILTAHVDELPVVPSQDVEMGWERPWSFRCSWYESRQTRCALSFVPSARNKFTCWLGRSTHRYEVSISLYIIICFRWPSLIGSCQLNHTTPTRTGRVIWYKAGKHYDAVSYHLPGSFIFNLMGPYHNYWEVKFILYRVCFIRYHTGNHYLL